MDLGTHVRDVITGFEGVITAHARNITGCDTMFVLPKISDGKMADGHWFDVDRLVVASVDKITIVPAGRPGAMDLAPPR